MILYDRKMKLVYIFDTLNIRGERAGYIVRKYLGIQKFCAKWVSLRVTNLWKGSKFSFLRIRILRMWSQIFFLVLRPQGNSRWRESTETGVYFEIKDASYYQNVSGMLIFCVSKLKEWIFKKFSEISVRFGSIRSIPTLLKRYQRWRDKAKMKLFGTAGSI